MLKKQNNLGYTGTLQGPIDEKKLYPKFVAPIGYGYNGFTYDKITVPSIGHRKLEDE